MVVARKAISGSVSKSAGGRSFGKDTKTIAREDKKGGLEVTGVRVFLYGILLVVTLGCSTPPFSRTVYVPSGTPVRLRADVPEVQVWILVDGKAEPGVLTLKEGWYVVPEDE